MLKSALSSPLSANLFDGLYTDDTPVYLFSNNPWGISFSGEFTPLNYLFPNGIWDTSLTWDTSKVWGDTNA